MNKKIMKRLSLIIAFTIFLQLISVQAKAISISAWGAIAIDGDTGEVLYEKNPDKMLVPASMTKIMTTYIIFEEIEAGRLTKDTLVTVSPWVAKISRDKNYPMSVPLESGGQYTVDQLIKLIMIPSASASCIAIAEHISGSEAAFVKRMNETAKRIGMEANFQNSHGARVHYTTPRGMAVLVKTFIDDYPDILNYTSLQGVDFNGKTYKILNKFMHSLRCEGADGFKTGTITEAKYCLASTAKRDGRRVIATVFGSSSQDGRYNDSRKILDLAFDKIKDKDIARKDTNLEILNLPEQARINAEYNTKLKFTNVSQNYSHNGKAYLDEKLIKDVRNTKVENDLVIDIPFCKEIKDKDFIELKYVIDLPGGGKKEIKKNIKISDEQPALYKDIKDINIEKKVTYLTEKGLMKGLENGYFGLDKVTTRGDFITTLGRLVEKMNLDFIEDKDSIYSDVKSSDYYNKYTVWAKENDLIQGYNGRFLPKKAITIEETAVILDKFFEKYNIEIKEKTEKSNVELVDLSQWARKSIDNLAKKDILFKDSQITINPKAQLKRKELVEILNDSIKNISEEKTKEEEIKVETLNRAI